jgi:hypothetical protein
MSKTSRASTIARNTNAIAGIKKRFTTAIVLVGVSYTPEALIALFQSHIDGLGAVPSAEGRWKAAILAARALAVTVDAVLASLLAVIRTTYVNQPDALADFGLVPKKPRTVDPVKQVLAAARNRATRLLRGTRGKKARLSIVGTVSASDVLATVTAAMAPAVPPPAAAAPQGAGGTRLP